VSGALASVRLAKQKIDRQVEKKSGFNVKLGRGGIREIEFIAQALQLAHGGRDEWLRVSHTLVSLGGSPIAASSRNRTQPTLGRLLVLRMLEHRLQMEHGLQTHTVPDADEAQSLLARRMGFASKDGICPNVEDAHDKRAHTYDRLFAETEPTEAPLTRTRSRA
jgi:glutamate-ammonia-ligase adenylyltransferase